MPFLTMGLPLATLVLPRLPRPRLPAHQGLAPYAFVAAGFGLAESALLVVATVNIHHFIVDAYIWTLRRDPNFRIVTEAGGAGSTVAVPA